MRLPGEQNELESLYGALNSLLAENESMEKKNLELQEEMNALRLHNDRDKERCYKIYAV